MYAFIIELYIFLFNLSTCLLCADVSAWKRTDVWSAVGDGPYCLEYISAEKDKHCWNCRAMGQTHHVMTTRSDRAWAQCHFCFQPLNPLMRETYKQHDLHLNRSPENDVLFSDHRILYLNYQAFTMSIALILAFVWMVARTLPDIYHDVSSRSMASVLAVVEGRCAKHPVGNLLYGIKMILSLNQACIHINSSANYS